MNYDDDTAPLRGDLEGFGTRVGLGALKDDEQIDGVSVDHKKPKPSLYTRLKQKFISETFQCMFASSVLLVVMGLIVLCFFYCQQCLFGIMLLSACLCPFMSFWNIPLWTSILLVTVLGINFVHKDFTFIWK